MRKLSAVIGMIALAMYASADVRNIRPPITGEGKIGTTTYKWGEVNAIKGYFSDLILGGHSLTNKFLSPYDGAAGEVFYADGLGGGVWGAASSPTNGISQAVAESLFATVAQGAKADAALPKDGSSPMTGDLDMDGYDIDDAGIVAVDRLKMNASVGSYMSSVQLQLTLAGDAKCGYNGNGDYIGAADGVGFYAVASTDTNKFSLTYLTTNNYIMVQSPLIHATSNYIEKITGFGTCTSNNYPVAGLSIGDNYVTFAHSETIGRTNLVTYTRFGSNLATVSPLSGWINSSINLHINGHIATGGLDRNENINIFLTWAADLTNPIGVDISSMMRTDYPVKDFVDVRKYKNQIILFGLYHTNAPDNRRIEKRQILCVASAISGDVTITTNK